MGGRQDGDASQRRIGSRVHFSRVWTAGVWTAGLQDVRCDGPCQRMDADDPAPCGRHAVTSSYDDSCADVFSACASLFLRVYAFFHLAWTLKLSFCEFGTVRKIANSPRFVQKTDGQTRALTHRTTQAASESRSATPRRFPERTRELPEELRPGPETDGTP